VLGSRRSPAWTSYFSADRVVLAEVQALGVFLLDRADRRRRRLNIALTPCSEATRPERARIRCADRLALVQHGRLHPTTVARTRCRSGRRPSRHRMRPIGFARVRVVDVAHAPQQRHPHVRRLSRTMPSACRCADLYSTYSGSSCGDRNPRRRAEHRPSARASRGRGPRAVGHGRCSRCIGITHAGGACSAISSAGVEHRLVVRRRSLSAQRRTTPSRSRPVAHRRCARRARSPRHRRTPPSATHRAARTPASRSPPRGPSACR